jgi:uncharacterized protein (TIGR04141 family)
MRRPLHCYLLRVGTSPHAALNDVGQADNAYRLQGEALRRLPSLEAADIANPDPDEIVVVTASSTLGPPWWQELLAEELNQPDFALGALPTRGAIVFCAAEDPLLPQTPRWLAWTFGTGSRYLDRRRLEPRFGVISALNRIIGEGSEQALLRKLQYREQGAYRQRVGHIASSDIPLSGFRMDQVRDLIAAAGGKSQGDDTQVFGGRNLIFRTDIPELLDTVRAESPRAMSSYREERYRTHFGFIDNYVPIDDQQLIAQLESKLMEEILENRDTVDFVYPDDLLDFNDERAIEFVLLSQERLDQASRKVLTIDSIHSRLVSDPGKGLDMELRFVDADRNLVGRVRLRDSLSAELRLGDDRYYLADGTYYDVNSEFIDRVDQDLELIPHWEISLPAYQGEREDEWIRRAAASGDFAVLDGELISLPGRTPFEGADLIHSSGAMLHVKRRSRSSALSYLFVQASVSSQLLGEVPDAVMQLRDLVERLAPSRIQRSIADALLALDRSRPDLKIVHCILGDWERCSITALPLIAKLELQATTRGIRQRGFHPHIALVPLRSRR